MSIKMKSKIRLEVHLRQPSTQLHVFGNETYGIGVEPDLFATVAVTWSRVLSGGQIPHNASDMLVEMKYYIFFNKSQELCFIPPKMCPVFYQGRLQKPTANGARLLFNSDMIFARLLFEKNTVIIPYKSMTPDACRFLKMVNKAKKQKSLDI